MMMRLKSSLLSFKFSVSLIVSAIQLRAVRSFSASALPPIKIFGYGDSLTAGWHDGGMSLTPYAPELQFGLEKALGGRPVLVRHKGLPGWTASSMVQAASSGEGLGFLLRRAQEAAGGKEGEEHTITACVIIAGTNDLAYASSAAEVAEAVLELHAIAHSVGVKTISVDIPPSAAALVQESYGSTASNDKLRIHVPCPVNSATLCYQPVVSAYECENGALWEDDGLHMSGLGYEALGAGLVPSVVGALQEWGVA